MSLPVDLNCDMGESFGAYTLGQDDRLMPHITSANIACGFHAGDPSVMRKTVDLAKQHGVSIGAHPGYPDLAGFGRRAMNVTAAEVYDMAVYQIGALMGVARAAKTRVSHVKAHGALYNAAATDMRLANALARAVHDLDNEMIFVGMSGSKLIDAGRELGLEVLSEVFPDRAYLADGTLAPRHLAGAVHTDSEIVVRQALIMVSEGSVIAHSGERVAVVADTLCIHGDGSQALQHVLQLRRGLADIGVDVRAPRRR